jgi:putative heme-binding domain-containing protein
VRRLALVLGLLPAPLIAEDLGLKVPTGFRVSLWADHTLANDIYTMTLDEQGRVVVTGPGYVRRLEDTDGDGKADKATNIAKTKTGAMGLLFAYDSDHPDTFDLYMSADGKVLGHNGDHVRNLYPVYHEMVPTFPFSEHGGHALKIGPDGYLYAVAGNDGRLDQLKRRADSPIAIPEGGGILRFRSWVKAEAEIVANGFRNPYDFDFAPLGDIITYDSDTERDFLLPWYMPTRVYHVLPGGHHGWRLPGYMRSLARPDYYPDTVEILADMGRGSPTGVCCYRHTQFPRHYRGGVFLLDWTFGRVYYLPLIPEGSSYQPTQPEVFLEPTGTNGFAPTAARVAPDGSLFVSIGGRGTRGGVYRVEYRVDGELPTIPKAVPDDPVDEVLDAPQPLEAWSQAKWIPLASQLYEDEFERVALSEEEPDHRRVRAIEVLVRRKDGITRKVADKLLLARPPWVRARLAWAMGTQSPSGFAEDLWGLAADPHPRVRTAALEGISRRADGEPYDPLFQGKTFRACLNDEDRRVRLAAAQIVSRIISLRSKRGDVTSWRPKNSPLWDNATPRALVALVAAYASSEQRHLLTNTDLLKPALRALDGAESPAERADAARAVMLAMGDWNLESPKVELHSAFDLSFAHPKEGPYLRLLTREQVKKLIEALPSTNGPESVEITRLLAMIEADHPLLLDKVLAQISPTTHPTLDFHFLTVLSRLPAARDRQHTERIAAALLGLDDKLAGLQLRIKQNWSTRLAELTTELIRHDPKLGAALAAHPQLARPGNAVIATRLTGRPRSDAARRLLAAVRADPDFPLSPDLVELLAERPAEEFKPVLRARWSDLGAREAMVKHLAEHPDPDDRQRFLEALETSSGTALVEAARALERLPRDASPENLVPLITRLRASLAEPKESVGRGALFDLIERQSGQKFETRVHKMDPRSLAAAYRPVFDWFAKVHPEQAKRLNQVSDEEQALRKALPMVNWSGGDVERGRKLYRERSCLACHSATTRIGPDLAGVTKRFSREDLLTAIVNPSREVAPAYRVMHVDTKDGKRITGVVVFESADGLIVQTGAAETRRIATDDIESTTPSPKSLMPDGLLRGLKPEELADLFAYFEKQ